MCGVIGYIGPSDPDLIKRLFLENNIRGQHATGISWVDGGSVRTFIHPGPAREFLKRVPDQALQAEKLVGHSRYSTSSLEYNQPISDEEMAVVHNGVITQEPPDTWEEAFGFRCRGENDTELILHAMLRWDRGEPAEGLLEAPHPLSLFEEGSMACCVLDSQGGLRWFRNGKRPLWFILDDRRVVVASSHNILSRTTKGLTRRCMPYRQYQYGREGLSCDIQITGVMTKKDWQHDKPV